MADEQGVKYKEIVLSDLSFIQGTINKLNTTVKTVNKFVGVLSAAQSALKIASALGGGISSIKEAKAKALQKIQDEIQQLILDPLNTGVYALPLSPRTQDKISRFKWTGVHPAKSIEDRVEGKMSTLDMLEQMNDTLTTRTTQDFNKLLDAMSLAKGISDLESIISKKIYDVNDIYRPKLGKDAEYFAVLFLAGADNLQDFVDISKKIKGFFSICNTSFTNYSEKMIGIWEEYAGLKGNKQYEELVKNYKEKYKSLRELDQGKNDEKIRYLKNLRTEFARMTEGNVAKSVEISHTLKRLDKAIEDAENGKSIEQHRLALQKFNEEALELLRQNFLTSALGSPASVDLPWYSLTLSELVPNFELLTMKIMQLMDVLNETADSSIDAVIKFIDDQINFIKQTISEFTSFLETINNFLSLTGIYTLTLQSSSGGMADFLSQLQAAENKPKTKYLSGLLLMAGGPGGKAAKLKDGWEKLFG
jgi:hypothetical protein